MRLRGFLCLDRLSFSARDDPPTIPVNPPCYPTMGGQEGVWSYLPLFLQMLRDVQVTRAGTDTGDRFDQLLRVS